MADAPRPEARARVLTGAYYGALFLGIGAYLPFWPVWLADWGLSEAEIGSFLAAGMVVRIAGATLVPALADRWAVRRLALGCSGLLGLGVLLAHLVAETRAELLIATLGLALFLAPAIPLGEALGLRAAMRHGFAYAPVRAVGSAAFLATNLATGMLVQAMGPGVTLWIMILCTGAVSLLGFLHPGGGAPPGALSDRAEPGELRRLALAPAFMIFALAHASGQASHGIYYAYSALEWTGRGIGAGLVGALWAFAVLVEVWLLLGPGQRLVAHIGPARALMLGAAAGLMRWGAMLFAPGLVLLWPLQALHALTFAIAHLGAMAFLAAAVPARLGGSAQGLAMGFLGGIAMAGATWAGGQVAGAAGPAAAYGVAVGFSALSLGLALVLARLWRGNEVV